MNETNKTGLVIAFVVVVVFFLFFSGGAMMTGTQMYGGGMMMGNGRGSGISWMWVLPALVTLGVGVLLGWVAFGKKIS